MFNLFPQMSQYMSYENPNENNMTTEPLLRLLKLISKYELYDEIFWRCDNEYAPISFFINCNDLFYWGTADAEKITLEDIDSLKQAVNEAQASCAFGINYGVRLWCARKRKMRPQGAAYPRKDAYQPIWALFDACGPERETGFDNPYRPGEYK
jgi:hypothetical protein